MNEINRRNEDKPGEQGRRNHIYGELTNEEE